jgi:hypothetical protein
MYGNREIIFGTKFVPVVEGNPVVFYMRNCAGDPGVTEGPVQAGAGHHIVICPDHVDPTRVSITKHATDNVGANRLVSVVLLDLPGVGTQMDIFVATDAGAPSDAAAQGVEATVARLPL